MVTSLSVISAIPHVWRFQNLSSQPNIVRLCGSLLICEVLNVGIVLFAFFVVRVP